MVCEKLAVLLLLSLVVALEVVQKVLGNCRHCAKFGAWSAFTIFVTAKMVAHGCQGRFVRDAQECCRLCCVARLTIAEYEVRGQAGSLKTRSLARPSSGM